MLWYWRRNHTTYRGFFKKKNTKKKERHFPHQAITPTNQLPTQHLCKPEPELLQRVPRNLFGPVLGIQRSFTRPNVCVSGVDEAGALDDFPGDVEDEEDWDADISSEEVGENVSIPGSRFVSENLEAVEDNNTGSS